jgi:hypothetical protein
MAPTTMSDWWIERAPVEGASDLPRLRPACGGIRGNFNLRIHQTRVLIATPGFQGSYTAILLTIDYTSSRIP